MTIGNDYQRGLTLLELLVAITLGLAVVTGTIQIYLGTSQTYRVQEAQSRIQENGRYALEVLNREIRMAGFTGCKRGNPVANVLNNAGSDWWSDFPNRSFQGYAGNDANFPARSFGSSSGDRVLGTEAIIIVGGGGQGYSISDTPPHNVDSAQFKLNDLHNLSNGDIVLICDQTQTSIMQITNVNQNNVTIVHNTGSSESPGNCTKYLGSPVDCSASPVVHTPHKYGSEANMIDFNPTAFYIGVNVSGDSTSLYRVRLSNSSGNMSPAAQELIEHVEDMHILYGVDNNNDGRVDNYVLATDVTNWSRVITVRLNLLLVSPPNTRVIHEAQTVFFPPEGFDNGNLVSGMPLTFNDGRLRQVFSTTIGIRNRLL